MDNGAYIANGHDAEETLGAIRAALVGLKPANPVLFEAGEGEWRTAWLDWIESRFLPIIAPHLISVREAPHGPREVVGMNSAFAKKLSDEEQAGGAAAAELLREALKGARHRPELDRLCSAFDVSEDRTAAQFSTLFAARCASHHISLSSTLASYLHFELNSGAPHLRGEGSAVILPLILSPARTAMESIPPSSYRVA